jgi:hypothetical protein
METPATGAFAPWATRRKAWAAQPTPATDFTKPCAQKPALGTRLSRQWNELTDARATPRKPSKTEIQAISRGAHGPISAAMVPRALSQGSVWHAHGHRSADQALAHSAPRLCAPGGSWRSSDQCSRPPSSLGGTHDGELVVFAGLAEPVNVDTLRELLDGTNVRLVRRLQSPRGLVLPGFCRCRVSAAVAFLSALATLSARVTSRGTKR